MNSLNESIAEMRASQKALKDSKKRLATHLKNAQKRKRRLKVKARLLSNEDLLEVLLLREEKDKQDSLPGGDASGDSDAAEAAPPAAGVGQPEQSAADMSAQ